MILNTKSMNHSNVHRNLQRCYKTLITVRVVSVENVRSWKLVTVFTTATYAYNNGKVMNENCTDEFTGKLEQNVDHISKNNLWKIQQRTISSPSIRAKRMSNINID